MPEGTAGVAGIWFQSFFGFILWNSFSIDRILFMVLPFPL
jgi:hypothetical protein